MSQVHGRVFSRLKRYEELPRATKRQLESLEQYLTANQAQIFQKHHPKLIKSVVGVKYKELIATVDARLGGCSILKGEASDSNDKTSVPSQSDATASANDVDKEDTATSEADSPQQEKTTELSDADPSAATSPPPPMKDTPTTPSSSVSHADDAPASPSSDTSDGRIPGAQGIARSPSAIANLSSTGRAQHLVEGLVLKGVLAPYKQDDKLQDLSSYESFDFKDSDLLVPVAADLHGLTEPTTTVWDVAAGAIYANVMRRKANLVEKLKYGKDVYVVVDSRTRTVTVFDDDTSHKSIVRVQAAGAQMSEDAEAFDCGVKVWKGEETEVFGLPDVTERDVFVAALREIGVKDVDGVGVAGMSDEDKEIYNFTDTMKQKTDLQRTNRSGLHGTKEQRESSPAREDPEDREQASSEKPTLMDKAATAMDKITPGASMVHNTNASNNQDVTSANSAKPTDSSLYQGASKTSPHSHHEHSTAP